MWKIGSSSSGCRTPPVKQHDSRDVYRLSLYQAVLVRGELCVLVSCCSIFRIESHGSILSSFLLTAASSSKWLLDRPQRGPTSTSIHPHTSLIPSQSGAKTMPGTAHPTLSRLQTPSPSGVVRSTNPAILDRRVRRPRPRPRPRPHPSPCPPPANRKTAPARPSPCRTHTSARRVLPRARHTPPTQTRSRFPPLAPLPPLPPPRRTAG